MKSVPYQKFRQHLGKYMNEVCDRPAPIHVTRQNAPTVVLMSEEEFEGILETMHLLRSPANADRLLRSIAEAEAAELTEHELFEPPTDQNPQA